DEQKCQTAAKAIGVPDFNQIPSSGTTLGVYRIVARVRSALTNDTAGPLGMSALHHQATNRRLEIILARSGTSSLPNASHQGEASLSSVDQALRILFEGNFCGTRRG